ncbi:MAG: hypothetical protein AUK47_01095 [Deltaproteobacteria bacterium CG2_30_63_29]|nr:MAG: hypothetical protein AUK47_01095 [Deltaproteobacteria bacterium CG2_30_63_29]PJB36556.1 MAG: hypothetical protein CO108_23045 [Deltaproteobacteria bacterium CG_4_9_14_3_um_filter_63_12]
MSETYILVGVVVGTIILVLTGLMVIIAKFYRKVDQGKALIINKMGNEPDVTFTGGVVYPIIHRAEIMDISVKTIEIDRRGKDGLVCQDNIRADIKVTFFVRVNKSPQDVLKVAQSIGCARASDQDTLEELFVAKFSEALKTVGKRLDFEELYTKRAVFRDQIIEIIGEDLNGFKLEDAAIDYLEQTPIEHLDKDNILDSQGIRKITEITTQQNVQTNELRQTERKAMKKEDVSADEAMFELERQRADAEARRDREIASVRARETAQTKMIQSEELSKSERGRLKAEEEIAIESENKIRQVEVAGKNRERIVGIETERVAKDRQLEAIQREREVELKRINKDKEVEVEKKNIADVVAERIAVEKNVAEQEEAIKDLRLLADATRNKNAKIITAEGEAQEKLVKDIKGAEAAEEVAKYHARERLTLAEADRESSDKHAQAKIRMAEGTQAEAAAEGLAAVRVREADAVAVEKLGIAEARVALQKYEAGAQGEEKQGMARARVKEADAEALQKLGMAEAAVIREKLNAEADGQERRGLAGAKVKEADAVANEKQGLAIAKVKEADAAALEKEGIAKAIGIEKEGLAHAVSIREKLVSEAAGLAQKAEAMKALDGVGREHEEFRLRLDKEKQVDLAQIETRIGIARAQADILSQAFSSAKINIVGGDGQFFDRFIRAVSVSQSIDGFVGNSDSVQAVLSEYLDGESSLPADLKEVLTKPAIGAETIQRLSLSALLARLATVEPSAKSKIMALIEEAKKLGIDQLKG